MEIITEESNKEKIAYAYALFLLKSDKYECAILYYIIKPIQI